MKTLVGKSNLRRKIQKAHEENKRVVKAVEELKRVGIEILKDEKWTIEKRVVIKKGQICTRKRAKK